MGAILDEFSWECFAPEADLVELEPKRWARQLDDAVELLFIESAWRGNGGRWSYALAHFDAPANTQLPAMLEEARRRDVPAVFWNKEDPPNFAQFAPAARHFPIVLTTAAECVDDYRRLNPDAEVSVLPFAAQPLLHHPVGDRRTAPDRVAFAGAWRADKYPARSESLEMLLDPAHRDRVLDIYDRHADGEFGEPFPDRYADAVRGSLTYRATVDAYRRYGAFLNVNTVDQSATMFSRRVFEILACGTPVISTPSLGMEQMLGEHVVIVESSEDVASALADLRASPDAWRRRGHRGYRHVHSQHTYGHRMQHVLDLVGVSPTPTDPRRVVVAARARRAGDDERLVAMADAQTVRPERIVVVVEHDCERSAESVDRADVVVRAVGREVSDSELLAIGIEEGADVVALWSAEHLYGPEFLRDAMLPFVFTESVVVGKWEAFGARAHGVHRLDGSSFVPSTHLLSGSLVVDVERWTSVVGRAPSAASKPCEMVDAAGGICYAADPFNFVLGDASGRSDALVDRDLRDLEAVIV